MLTSASPSGGGDWARARLPNFSVFHPPVASYGTHHSKFLLVAYDTHVRVCIHTANYLVQDWGDKSEGVWMQDFALKQGKASGGGGAAGSSAFEDDLVDYLVATRWPGGPLRDGRRCDAQSLRAYDFAAARVALVASVPGSHDGARYGHRRVRALLQREAFDASAVASPLVFQYTSNGTVRAPLLHEFRQAFSAGRTAAGAPLGLGELKLVWPTVQEVRRSYEGWAAAGVHGGRAAGAGARHAGPARAVRAAAGAVRPGGRAVGRGDAADGAGLARPDVAAGPAQPLKGALLDHALTRRVLTMTTMLQLIRRRMRVPAARAPPAASCPPFCACAAALRRLRRAPPPGRRWAR